jgi:uncharacterized membrane protein (Fun14 family)
MFDVASLFATGSLISLVVEFGLGFALGYYLKKYVKAMLGLLALGFIGVLINYAQFVTLSENVTQKLGVTPQQFIDVITAILPFLALTVIAPLAVGVIIGFLVGR